MSTVERVLDVDGRLYFVGARVHIDGEHPIDEAIGTVYEITDADGDVDEEGRPYGIPPRVRVRFDDDTEEDFAASSRFEDDPRVDELRIIGCSICGDTGQVPVDPQTAARYSRSGDPDGVNAPETTDCVCA